VRALRRRPEPPLLAVLAAAVLAAAPARGEAVWVDSLRLVGNASLPDELLQTAVRPWLGRHLGPAEIQRVAAELTRVYVDAGYVNSGARLGEEPLVEGGTWTVEIVEGRLAEVRVEGTDRRRARYVEERLRREIGAPLRIDRVERALRLLEAEPTVGRLDAHVRATRTRGAARLDVRVEEERPWWAEVGADNHAPPAVGTAAGRFAAGHDDALGRGDRALFEGAATRGLWQVALAYDVPVHASGTRLRTEARLGRGEIVQSPFDDIDVESQAWSLSGALLQPLRREPGYELWLGLMAEHRFGETTLLGRGFTFAPGADDGEVRLTLLRPWVELQVRGRRAALSVRSLLTWGVGGSGTTRNAGDVPDARFVAWLGQARGVYREARTGVELHGRLDVQLASEPLLALEQFPLGGPGSVRGYERNLLVRDQAAVASLEARWPMVRGRRGRTLVEPLVFGDVGRAWNRARPTPGKRTLSSLGLGLRVHPVAGLVVDLEWAFPLRSVDDGESLQAQGLLAAIRWRLP